MMIKKRAFFVVCMIILFCAPLAGCGADRGPVTRNRAGAAHIDFSQLDGSKTQYIKKFDSFSSTWGFVGDATGTVRQTSVQQLSALRPLKAESMRFDLFMGYTGLGYEIGRAGNQGLTDAEYVQSMQVIRALAQNKVLPYLVYFASPEYTQVKPSWKAVPDLDRWQTLCGNIAGYLKSKGIRVGGHEIWNEPDFGSTFFAGSWQDYIDMYVYGAKGIRSAHPDALVGGVSAAFIDELCAKPVTLPGDGSKTNFERFIQRAAEAGELPDFISWHYYGRGGRMENVDKAEGYNFSKYRGAVLNALQALQEGRSPNLPESYPELVTMQQHLNEFNVYAPGGDDIYRTAAILPGMFEAIEVLLGANDITRAAWAGLLCEWQNDLAYDMIDTVTLRRYPSYHALWSYGRLPIARAVQPTIDGIGTLAGVDPGRAAAIVYNRDADNRNVKIAFDNVPFQTADVTVYQVDDEHPTYAAVDEPWIAAEFRNVNPNELAYNLSLRGNSMYYIEANAVGKRSDTERDNSLRDHIVRKDYYYPRRGDNTPYADLHENSFTACLSMNGNETGTSAMSVTMENMKNIPKLAVDYRTYGDPDGGGMGFKIDYQTAAGYTKSVYCHLEGQGQDLALPFGKKSPSERTLSLGGKTGGRASVDLAAHAPEDWTGRIVVSYLITDAGRNATAQFILSEEE